MAEAELRKAGGELAGVVHQRIAFSDTASRGESVLTSSSTEEAADDIRRLWRNVKGGKAHESKPQETKPGAKPEAREGGRRGARRTGRPRSALSGRILITSSTTSTAAGGEGSPTNARHECALDKT